MMMCLASKQIQITQIAFGTKNVPSHWPQWNRLSRIYFLSIRLHTQTHTHTYTKLVLVRSLARPQDLCKQLPNNRLSHIFPHAWDAVSDQRRWWSVIRVTFCLFTLVFNLKFNLLKQLKAHTSPSNIHTYSSHCYHAGTVRQSSSFVCAMVSQPLLLLHISRSEIQQTIPFTQLSEAHERRITRRWQKNGRNWIDCIRHSG